jgi:anti-sigma regulatory factor (Ser/Thr protein kinase)
MIGLPDVYRAGLALPVGGGRQSRFTVSDRARPGPVEWCLIDAYDDVPLNTAVRTGQPVFGALDHLEDAYADFVERQRQTATVAVAAVPIVAAGETVGGLVVFFQRRQEFRPAQRDALMRLGEDLGTLLRDYDPPESHPRLAAAPSSPEAKVAVHSVAADLAAVSVARRFLGALLEDWGVDEDTRELAVLCLSELVTNALIHGQAGCVVRVVQERDVLTTTVRDGGPEGAISAVAGEEPLEVHGRGLRLVDALVSRWGSATDATGTTVWFAVPC